MIFPTPKYDETSHHVTGYTYQYDVRRRTVTTLRKCALWPAADYPLGRDQTCR
jgi:hypothetical protein